MREILYRGKRIDNDEWVFGYYCPCVFGNFPAEPAIIDADELKNGKWVPVKVNPETIGQYIGLKDTNVKKIFDGDIVQWEDENFNNYTSVVEWCGEKWNYPAFDLAKHDYECNGLQYVHEDCIIEVIGTIYDNPELLEMKK